MDAPARTRATGARLISAGQRRTAAVALAGVGAVAVLDPNTTHVPLCPLHAWTGLWCPFCGTLRATFELTRLRLMPALHDNVLFVAAIPILVLLWLDSGRRSRAGQPRRGWPRGTTVALIGLAVAFTIVRNLPFATGLRGGLS